MLSRSLRVLEFPKVLEIVAGEAATEIGREFVREILPEREAGTASLRQAETQDAERLLGHVPFPPVGPREDIRPLVDRALRGSLLTGAELRAIVQVPSAARRMKELIGGFGQPEAPLGSLLTYAKDLTVLSSLEARIESAITEAGEVADEASPLLSGLRARQRAVAVQVREKLERLIRSPETARYLMEPIITVRGGRYVVPVRAEARRMVPGLVHDTSQSGQTLFVEPMAVLELGNDLRRLEAEGREEELRILTELTERVREEASLVREDAEVLGALDTILARSRSRRHWSGTYPELAAEPRLVLRRARHPLLGASAVPIDVELGRTFRTLVISGPNTGGKTLTLKTMGLLSAMALSGLTWPAEDGSQAGAFDRIFADIGDEQSIEQSLSTFSSHLSSIIRYLETADERSLVLLDELGAGTDPTEGAALARAVLESLHARGARTAVTTHLSDLKRHAAETLGMENGSVEFDVRTLRPTYRFHLGVPGESNAFAIAMRLGMPPDVVARARHFLTPESTRVEDLLQSIGETRRTLAEEEASLRATRAEAEAALAALRKEQAKLDAEKEEILLRARERAREVVARARRETEAGIAALRAAAQGTGRPEAAIEEARRRLRQAAGWEDVDEPRTAGAPLSRIYVGQRVLLRDMGQEATVLEEPAADGKVTVQAGNLRLRVEQRGLAQGAQERPRRLGRSLGQETSGGGRESGAVRIALARARETRPELDLRGKRADEAESDLRVWLDDALLAGLPQGRVIHGKGTGALRDMVQGVLRADFPAVKSRLGQAGEGGDGVTVVVFSAS